MMRRLLTLITVLAVGSLAVPTTISAHSGCNTGSANYWGSQRPVTGWYIQSGLKVIDCYHDIFMTEEAYDAWSDAWNSSVTPNVHRAVSEQHTHLKAWRSFDTVYYDGSLTVYNQGVEDHWAQPTWQSSDRRDANSDGYIWQYNLFKWTYSYSIRR